MSEQAQLEQDLGLIIASQTILASSLGADVDSGQFFVWR
jgi:hypothetical protein